MLSAADQIASALVHGPLAPLRLRRRGLAWLVVYLGLAALILYLVGSWLAAHRGDITAALVDYVFPEDWRFAGELLVERIIAAQDRVVLINAAIGVTLIVVQICLFWVKEQLSAAYEAESRLVDETPNEFPLWFQAWEEIVLFLIFIAAQASIFWIGYSPDPSRQALARVLSYAFLFASFSIDFLAPVLQRHRQKYSTVLKVLIMHPLLLLGFGAVFTVPSILVGRSVAAHGELSFRTALIALFAANVVSFAWAAIAGTRVGAALLPDARATRAPGRPTRAAAWLLLAAALSWNGYRFGAVGLSLHHKSQLLKCNYSIDWTSIGVDAPSALGLVGSLRRDAIEVGVHFEVTIENPTGFDVEIEENHVDVTHDGQRVARTQLPRLSVPAGGRSRTRVELPLRLTPSQLARGRELLRSGGWAVTLWLRVAPGFDFPIYLLEASPR